MASKTQHRAERGAHNGATQAGFLRYKDGNEAEKEKALCDLTHLAIAKCRDIYPPYYTDEKAENLPHAMNRQRINRYTWIRNWLRIELNTRPNDNGNFLPEPPWQLFSIHLAQPLK